jgi:hypothetical protein
MQRSLATPKVQMAMVSEASTQMAQLWLAGYLNDTMEILRDEFGFGEEELTRFTRALRAKKRSIDGT